MSIKLTLSRAERLRSKKRIAELFREGKGTKQYPLALRYMYVRPQSDEVFPQVAFSVSKKRVPKAHNRNLIKRRMREAYRLQKAEMKEEKTQGLVMMWIYLPDTVLSYEPIFQAIEAVLGRLQSST